MVADTGYFNCHDFDPEWRLAGQVALPAGGCARRYRPAPRARHLHLVVIFKPRRLRFAPEQRLPLLFYGLSLGAMNYLFYLSIQRIPLGVAVALEFTGPLAVALFGSRRPLDFVWVALAVLGLWFLLPLGQSVAQIDPIGALLALGAGACWAVYILTGQRAGEEHGPATVAMGSLIAAVVFVPMGMIQPAIRSFSGGYCCRDWGSPFYRPRCPTLWKWLP